MTNVYGRILCIDDNPRSSAALVSSLEDSGFLVYEANNQQDVLSIFREKKPNLVVGDFFTPLMGGLALLSLIKQESEETPVIVVSGTQKMSDVLEALRAGAWDYIAKPLSNIAVLDQAVCRALERSRLVVENRNYRIQLEEKNTQLRASLTQLEEDQCAGKSVQQKLLPKAQSFGKINLTYKIYPSLYLSGDFVDYFKIDKNRVGVYIADVSGHGASSAFVTVLIKSLVNKLLADYDRLVDDCILFPEKVLKNISDDVYTAKLGKYLTMVYGVINLKENTLCYSVGGHYPNPILWDGKQATFLPGEGFAVGIYGGASYKSLEVALPTDFTLGLFSDGIFEIMKGKNLAENEATLLTLFDHTPMEAESILEALGVGSGRSFPDDITLLMINGLKNSAEIQ